MLEHPKVLLLCSDEAETSVLQGILSEHVILTCARNLTEMQGLLKGGGYDALFCDWAFHMGTWKDVLEEVQQRHPNLPVIILPRTAGEQEWAEVLKAEAFDLLVPPCRERADLGVVEQAGASRNARSWRNTAEHLGKIAS